MTRWRPHPPGRNRRPPEDTHLPSPPDSLFDDVAGAILDGSSVEWTELESHQGAIDRALIDQLRVLAAVRAVARSSGASDEAAPRFWGHLRVLEPIGRGAFGEVYRAWDTRLDREVALKVLALDHQLSDRRSAFIEEGRLLARVRHPNVVTLYGAERIGDEIGLWMEFVRGRTLEQMLGDGTVLTPKDIVRLGLELCGAVSAVHAAGLLHRDIKAQNVMVADDGRLVLMDFGTGHDLGSTSGGSVGGTPLYLAPEVLSGGTATAGSDIYSVGVLLYHLLTGAYPVRASTLEELRRAHAEGQRIDLRSLRADVPPRLARVIERAVDRHAGRRYVSADALAADLAAIGTSPRFVRAVSVIGVTLALALLIWGGWLLQGRLQRDRGSPDPSPRAGGSTVPSPMNRAVPVLSLPGETFQLAISPDGSQLALVWAAGGGANLHVNRLGAEKVLQLTHTPGNGSSPAWSPDGRFIAFKRHLNDARTRNAISVVSAAGGPYRTVWSGDLILGRGLDWSPDGAHLVWSARTPEDKGHRLFIMSVTTGETEWLTSPVDGSDDTYPVFSPDGHALAFARNAGTEPGIYLLGLDSRKSQRLMIAQSPVKRLAWSPDGQSLFFASEEGAGNGRLWKMRVAGGQVEPLPGTGAGATEPSVARGTGQLVFLQETLDRNLYRAHLSAGSSSSIEQLPGTIRSETYPDISPDGSRIAFVSDRTGNYEIWTADSRGANPRPVTSLRSIARHPRWAPDGQRLAFVGLNAGANNHDIYVAHASGAGLRRLTDEPSTEQWPAWSHDGKWIYFASDRTGTWQLWKVPDGGGIAVQVTTKGGLKAWESRDGQFVFYSDRTYGIWRMPVAGGPSERLLDFPHSPTWGGEWVPTERGIFFVNVGGSPQATFDLFDFATRRSSTVLTLPGLYDDGSGFTVSRDGAWLMYTQRDVARSEIMQMNVDR